MYIGEIAETFKKVERISEPYGLHLFNCLSWKMSPEYYYKVVVEYKRFPDEIISCREFCELFEKVKKNIIFPLSPDERIEYERQKRAEKRKNKKRGVQ